MNNFIKKIKASLENFKTEIEFPPKDDSNKIFLYSFSNKYKISIKIISISLCVCILLSSAPFKIYANNTNDDNVSDNSINDSKTDDKIPVGSSTGHSNVRTVNDIISQQKFNSKTGHIHICLAQYYQRLWLYMFKILYICHRLVVNYY